MIIYKWKAFVKYIQHQREDDKILKKNYKRCGQLVFFIKYQLFAYKMKAEVYLPWNLDIILYYLKNV